MTTEVVLDSSAVLAEIHGEAGRDVVHAVIRNSAMSSMNFAEVISQLHQHGVPREQAEFAAELLGFEVLEADKSRAVDAGLLHGGARRSGLSLADAFCLALARELRLPALTGDRRWAELGLGVEVRLIR